MSQSGLVLYLHRFGTKLYQVKTDSTIQELSADLSSIQGSTLRLLLADSISYLYRTEFTPNLKLDYRQQLLTAIKSDIPENFSASNWDYKLLEKNGPVHKVLVFAPVSEFLQQIASLADQYQLNFEAVEPEAVAATRHPNPIIGILIKDDISSADSDSLNLKISSSEKTNKLPRIPLVLILGIVVIGLVIYSLSSRFHLPSTAPSPSTTPTNTPDSVPSLVPATPTPLPLSGLRLQVQNGSGVTGAAAKTAALFSELGPSVVDTANADKSDYLDNNISFRSASLKDKYLLIFQKILTFKDVLVDTTQTYDVILIKGIN